MRSKENSGNWILVANSARAIIIDDRGADAPLTVLQVLRHPEGRKSAAELVTDQPGRGQSSTGRGATLAPRTDPHRGSQAQFAAEIAKTLEESHGAKQFSGLIVAASSPFYGVLLEHLSPQVKKAIVRKIERDLSDLPLYQLREKLVAP